ncbi:TonB-dependent receptor [Sphingomonadaceae bacterium jetA1]|jgi:outer membrane receptor protein involved in Fe transport|uniref:TonB-dependent receptor domain-containing protein n=1 Tax=Facivitalis istanbulensis TaxID=3075838 RepID=UPI00346C4453
MKIRYLLEASALAGSLALAFPAIAQTTPTTSVQTEDGSAQNAEAHPSTGGEVIVTGSRIRRPNDQSPVPISTVSAAELTSTSRISIGDVLNDLPQLQSTFSSANSTRFLGTAGLNLLDLRGLGPVRTLVLVNGRRHVASDILNNATSVDVNTIPTDLIEAVDIVTGGNSAVYGSDALAGVVNFRLKQDFQGLQVRGQGGVSQHGDAGAYFISATGGTNFNEGRGNIAVNVEYARQNSLYASQRRALRHNDSFVTVDADSPGIAPGQTNMNYDGNPDSVFFRDIRSATISAGGLIGFASPNGACGRDTQPNANFGGAGRPFTCNFLFQPGGALAQQVGSRVGLGQTVTSVVNGTTVTSASSVPTGAYIGGNGDTRREGMLVQILPQTERYAANLIAHYDFSDAFKPFVEAKYVRTNTFGQGTSGPAFFTGQTLGRFNGNSIFYERPRLDNPFLSTDSRATLTTQALALANAGFNPTTGAAFATPAAQAATVASINDGSYRFVMRKNLVDLGVRSEESRRDVFRIVGGFRGDISDHFNYEVAVNYGQFDEKTRVLGNLNVQRMLLALDAQRGPNGQIVCGSQIAGNTAARSDFAGNPAVLAADIAACQPLNPFGQGSISQAARNYVLQDTTSVGRITQFDTTAFISGDLGQLFTLPGGGSVGFSLGGEYRRETARYHQDPLVSSGYTFYNAIADFTPPSFEVKEAFGEVSVPLLRDLPFAKELTLSGAGRVSDYKGAAGTVWTYSVSGVYSPISDIRLRANYSRAVRAPNLTELYNPLGQNFASNFKDPCSARYIASGTQFRAANCAAQGIPTSYDYNYQQSLEIMSGGNTQLTVEKSDSYTYGAQFIPSFAPGLSLSIDYYNIKVNNVITAPTAQAIVNSCYDTPSTSNQFCGLFKRVASGQTGPNGEEAYRIEEGSLQQVLLNYAKLQVRGLDVDLAYQRRFGDMHLTSHIIYTHQFQNDSFLDPTQPGFANARTGELGYPRDQVNWNIGANFTNFFANAQMRYITKMSIDEIENMITFQGRPPQNLDAYDIPYYPDVFYLDLKFGANVTPRTNFYFGMDNVTNRIPPLGATGTGAGSGIYEPVGRRLYAGFQARF